MRGTSGADCSTSVLGTVVSLLVLLAPVGPQRLLHPGGELVSAAAAREARTIFSLSTTATISIEEVAEIAGSWWFQLYQFRDRAIARELVERAEQAGASA